MSNEQFLNLLTVIIDVNATWWGKFIFDEAEAQVSIGKKTGRSIASFCNTFKYQSSLNHLFVVTAGANEHSILYSDFTDQPEDLNDCVIQGLRRCLLNDLNSHNDNSETKFSSAIATALCYTNRLRKQWVISQTLLSRVLVVKFSDNVSSEHMNLMNLFFTAQKQGVMIDACILGPESTLFQQACDITGGVYMKIAQSETLLQNLLVPSLLPEFS